MSDQEASHGSELAEMFGFVTPEDRSKWEGQRRQRAKRVGSIKAGMKAAGGSMAEFSSRNIEAKLSAAHRAAQAKELDNETEKSVRTRFDEGSQSIVETVDWSRRKEEDAGFEF